MGQKTLETDAEKEPFHHHEEEGRVIRSVDDLIKEEAYIEKFDPRNPVSCDDDSLAPWLGRVQNKEIRRLMFAQLSIDGTKAIFYTDDGPPEEIFLEGLGVIPNEKGLWDKHKYLVRA